MINIKEVKTRKDIKNFINFPLKLYKNNKYYVPSLYSSEKAIFKKDYPYNENTLSKFFLAFKDNKIVGRIQVILSYPSNEKWNQKRVRFTRFDSINDQEVANALFDKAKEFALSYGMNEINGPLGYSDLEREGLLISGFNYLNTYQEQYNYSYYQKLIENYGFKKEIDWLEHRLFKPKPIPDKISNLINFLNKKYNLRVLTIKSKKELLDKYADKIFDLIDDSYDGLYQTVPLTKNQISYIIKDFKTILNTDLIRLVVDKNDDLIAFGFCLPSLSDALKGSKGKLTNLLTLYKLLKALSKPQKIDFCLIGVRKDYRSTGIATLLLVEVMKLMNENEFDYCETNLTLETNTPIINCWKRFDSIYHKRRRCYIYNIEENIKKNM